MILGICSTGEWLSVTKGGTTKSDDFCLFLVVFEQFLLRMLGHELQEVVITLDNAPVHLAKKTSYFANELSLEMHLLPPYSPVLAPAELVFGIVKNAISKEGGMGTINY